MHLSPRCLAKTRRGKGPCQPPAMRNGRCRMHGGSRPGAPIGNRHALKHGFYAAGAIEERLLPTGFLRATRELVGDKKTIRRRGSPP
ncbi:HGGxSTG domain-containing protein [Mesorhizobium sp. 14Argb]